MTAPHPPPTVPLLEESLPCATHANRPALGKCRGCKKGMCAECARAGVHIEGQCCAPDHMYWHADCREAYNRRQNILRTLYFCMFIATGGFGTWATSSQ